MLFKLYRFATGVKERKLLFYILWCNSRKKYYNSLNIVYQLHYICLCNSLLCLKLYLQYWPYYCFGLQDLAKRLILNGPTAWVIPITILGFP